jgi:hypothetical protein
MIDRAPHRDERRGLIGGGSDIALRRLLDLREALAEGISAGEQDQPGRRKRRKG